MLALWDYVNIIGIIFQIIGFIILLAGFQNKIKFLLMFTDFILRISKLKEGQNVWDYDKVTKPVIDENRIKVILGRWNRFGILLVILGLLSQIISILIEKS